MGAFEMQPRRKRFSWRVSGADDRSCVARLFSSQVAERVQRLVSDETCATRHAQPDNCFSNPAEAEKIIEYWKNTGIERLQKAGAVDRSSAKVRPCDQRLIWLYTPLLLWIAINAIGWA